MYSAAPRLPIAPSDVRLRFGDNEVGGDDALPRVVVLPAPAPEAVRVAVHGEELLRADRAHAAEHQVVGNRFVVELVDSCRVGNNSKTQAKFYKRIRLHSIHNHSITSQHVRIPTLKSRYPPTLMCLGMSGQE